MAKGKPYIDIRGYSSGVTGSAIRNTVHFSNGSIFRYLVDYGMYQGENHNRGLDYNDSINPKKINTILLTHTHHDHDGALPIFIKNGYDGKVYMSEAARAVIDIGMNDSHPIMKNDAKILKKPPLYSHTDIDKTLSHYEGVKFEHPIKIHDNITVTFFNNGHLIGSAIILVQIHEPQKDIINLLYIGDYKHENVFLKIKSLPYWVYNLKNLTIVSEATYGTTNSWDIAHNWENDLIKFCSENKIVVNTAFAQGRFQELLYRIRKLQDEGHIPKDYPVRADGKSGINYTFRYISHSNIIQFKDGIETDFFPYNLQFINNSSRNSVLNCRQGQIIITTSGMGSNGPAKMYIPYYLKNKNSVIYFPGYTAEGTVGRRIYEAKDGETVYIYGGQPVEKRATVLQTLEFSSHDTADLLIDFYSMFKPRAILFTHGTLECKEALSLRTQQQLGIKHTGILGNGYVYRIDSYGIAKAVQK